MRIPSKKRFFSVRIVKAGVIRGQGCTTTWEFAGEETKDFFHGMGSVAIEVSKVVVSKRGVCFNTTVTAQPGQDPGDRSSPSLLLASSEEEAAADVQTSKYGKLFRIPGEPGVSWFK